MNKLKVLKGKLKFIKAAMNHAERFYEFGYFRLDPVRRLLLREGAAVSLTPKAFDLLLTFIENKGRVLGKDELMRRVWSNNFVEEGNLTVNIFALRRALGENPQQHEYIVTVPGRGYCFVADVREISSEEPKQDALYSITVLPFQVFGIKDEYLGLGLSDALATKLGNLKQLVVRPAGDINKPAASGQDAITVGRELKADWIIEGNLRQAGERIRVTAKLIDVKNAAQVWAGKFDENFTDIFALEDSISEQIATALELRLTEEEQAHLAKRHSESGEAYQAYLKGRYFWSKRTPENLQKGIDYFEQAIALDSRYALAYAGLADSFLLGHKTLSPCEAMARAKAAALKALEINNTLAEAHTSLARVQMNYEWDWTAAEASFGQALKFNLNYATAHQWYANLLTATGRHEEAIRAIQRAQQLDPLSLIVNNAYGWILYMARRYDEALAQYQKTLELEPTFVQAQTELGMTYEQLGKYAKAVEALQTARQLSPENTIVIALLAHVYAVSGERAKAERLLNDLQQRASQSYVSPHLIAMIYAGLGQKRETLAWLEKSYADHSSPMLWLKVDPYFDEFRSEAEFTSLLHRLRLLR